MLSYLTKQHTHLKTQRKYMALTLNTRYPNTIKPINKIIANPIGTATIATTLLTSFAQRYKNKAKKSLRLYNLYIIVLDINILDI
jgi:hypothetical protein